MSLRTLYELQDLDWVRAERQQMLAEAQAELADESRLTRARRSLAELEARYTGASALLRDAQLVVERLEERAQVVENRLYSGAVTNPRELGAFQDEQAMLRRQTAEAEDVLLERMVEAEELQEALESARQTANELNMRRQERVPQLRQQEEALTSELHALNGRRAEMLPQISAQTLSTYEALLVSRGGHAVSKVEPGRGVCEACRIALPRSDMRRVRSADAVVQCNNCRRILYLE